MPIRLGSVEGGDRRDGGEGLLRMPPLEVIEIAAAAVSCAASGGLSLGSGGWTSSCATDARLLEV